jgi:integrase
MADQKSTTRHRNDGLRKRCSCPRRAWANCPHSWHFYFQPKGGANVRFTVDEQAGTHIAAKTEAETLAEGWRGQIRAGTFQRRRETDPPPMAARPDVITFARFCAIYAERLGKPVARNHTTCVGQLVAFPLNGQPFGQRPLGAITQDDLEAIVGHLRAEDYAASSVNKYINTIKVLFRWATKKGYLARNPAEDSDALTRSKAAQRHRRLEADEEAQLLTHAGPSLQRLIIGALETGCRKRELLTLQWGDVNLARRELTIRSEKAKTRQLRTLPISARLLAVLKMATTDPAGQAFGAEAFVFGDAVGRPLTNISKAWETCVLKAHGHAPIWTRRNALAAPARAAYRAVGLVFHDLRHEAGSRFLEGGMDLHEVRHMLGHANISQTSTYLNATKVGLQDAMRRFDAIRSTRIAHGGAKRASASVLRRTGKRGLKPDYSVS